MISQFYILIHVLVRKTVYEVIILGGQDGGREICGLLKGGEEFFLKQFFGCRDEVLKHCIFSRVLHNNIEEDSNSKKLTCSKSLAPPQIPNPNVDPSTVEVYVVNFLFPNYAKNFYFSVLGKPPIILCFQLSIPRFLNSNFSSQSSLVYGSICVVFPFVVPIFMFSSYAMQHKNSPNHYLIL